MLSWQARLLKLYFRLRRCFVPATGLLNVEQERAEAEALAARFGAPIHVQCQPVVANGVPGEWLTPASTTPGRVLFYLHGGSYIAGSITSHRSLVANLALATQARALLIDYRLAPEHPFPAALEDALTAYCWLRQNDRLPSQLVIAGDSAGGGLALALLVSLRDQEMPLPDVAVCLSPWTDLAASGPTWTTNARVDLLNDGPKLRRAARLYLGQRDPRNPLASPLYADLHGLPPLLIQVGSDELLLSDATQLTERAQAAGTPVTLEVWPGMQHQWHFASHLLPESRQAIQRIGAFVAER